MVKALNQSQKQDMPLSNLLLFLHSTAHPCYSQHVLLCSTPRLQWQCTDRTCFTLHCPLSPVLSCCPCTLRTPSASTCFAAGLLAAETHSTCLLLWSNSQTPVKLVSFSNWLKTERKKVFKQGASSPKEIASPLLYQTHCDLRNTHSKFCCTEKFLLPRNPPHVNSSSNSETYLKLLESFFSPFKKIPALGLGAAVRASLLKLQSGFF